mgnify:CR=1 FL=1
MEMRTTIFPYGAPELSYLVAALTEICHYHKLPMFGTAGCSDSYAMDAQAAAEVTYQVILTMLSGADLVLVLTNDDNTNIMVSQIIKQQFKVKRNICRVDDPVRARAYEELGIETFCPTVFSVELLKKICSEPKRIRVS